MRIFLVLISSLALASVGYAAHEEDKPEAKKKRARQEEHAAARERERRAEQERRHFEERKAHRLEAERHPVDLNKPSERLRPPPPHNLTTRAKRLEPFHAHHLILPNKPSRLIAPVRYDPARRLVGSERWVGRDYAAFRLYRPAWHDRFWWRNHYNRVVLIGGGAYYWNAGFWYPAWGYDPGYAYYPYDGPIYAYNNLPPDQVIGNVQTALQQQGYYQGAVDGLLGPLTRAAIANYQRANPPLAETGAIDQPTLQSLGMT